MARLHDNLVRLGVTNVRPVRCDWLDENSIRAAGLAHESFDKILVDAPCSNTGVMRRRVDVRWRLGPDDFIRVSRRQLAILRAVARLLKPGGSLVYSTCSLEPEENDAVIAEFLRSLPNFRLTDRKEGLPFRDEFDGAFAAAWNSGPNEVATIALAPNRARSHSITSSSPRTRPVCIPSSQWNDNALCKTPALTNSPPFWSSIPPPEK